MAAYWNAHLAEFEGLKGDLSGFERLKGDLSAGWKVPEGMGQERTERWAENPVVLGFCRERGRPSTLAEQ